MNAWERLDALSPEARAAAIDVLDAISRPMLPQEIADALHGEFSRRERRGIAKRLAPYAVIVLHPPA